MKTPKIFCTFLIVCSALLAAGAQADSASQAVSYDLGNFDPGNHVAGPKFPGKMIKGKVVVIEYWGVTCGPCLRAIPHTTELAKKYGHDKLIIIANHSWSASDEKVREVWNERAKNNMVMVVNGGKLKDFRTRTVPRVLIFDHTGKSVWEGHPGSMDRPLEKAVANLPEPTQEPTEQGAEKEKTGPASIVDGFEPKAFRREVRTINAQNRNIASLLAKLRRAAERSSTQARVDEAKQIVAAVQAWAISQQAKADAAIKDDPATAYQAADKLVTLLKGDELADSAAGIIAQIKKDPGLFDTVRATLALRGILADAASIGLDEDKSVLKDRKKARSVRSITRNLDNLIKAYPQTEAGKQAKTLQSEWGLDD